jgi:transcriptional regulator with XRE-family HTH domain
MTGKPATIGSRLLARANALGISQGEVARRVGVSRVSVNNWVHGRARPSAPHIVLIARALGITSNYLLGITPPEQPKEGEA